MVKLGVSKVLMGFPATTNGFFKEVKEEYVEKGLGLKLLIASWISLAAGKGLVSMRRKDAVLIMLK